jgi:hypothetical protein
LEEKMRVLRFLNVAILSTLVATSAALYAQDEKHQQEDKPPRQDEARPQPRQDEMKAPRQDETKPSRQDKQEQKQQEKQSHEQMKEGRQEPAQQGTHARPAGKGGHIPDNKFRAQFGRSHTFAVQRTTVINGQPGFYYGGYSFVFVDAWPGDWAYSDDCYVDYVDGDYFLFDLLHPGERIALIVIM